MPKNRAIVYIDGFNLYYNAVKKTRYKWLDIVKLSEELLPHEEVIRVKFFTAKVLPLGDRNRPDRQEIYWRALRSIYTTRLEIIEGNFREDPKFFPIARHQFGGKNSHTTQKIWIMKHEEKRSDVNLGVHLVNDAWKKLFDVALVISNDTDLVQALKIARSECHKKIIIANPKIVSDAERAKILSIRDNHEQYIRNIKEAHIELRKASSTSIIIPDDILSKCQLPTEIPDTPLKKPDKWF